MRVTATAGPRLGSLSIYAGGDLTTEPNRTRTCAREFLSGPAHWPRATHRRYLAPAHPCLYGRARPLLSGRLGRPIRRTGHIAVGFAAPRALYPDAQRPPHRRILYPIRPLPRIPIFGANKPMLTYSGARGTYRLGAIAFPGGFHTCDNTQVLEAVARGAKVTDLRDADGALTEYEIRPARLALYCDTGARGRIGDSRIPRRRDRAKDGVGPRVVPAHSPFAYWSEW